MHVACLSVPARKRSRDIASAMAAGIRLHGDTVEVSVAPTRGDVCIGYGWKFRSIYQRFPAYIYADIGYWQRDSYYRLAVNGWSPERYVRAGLPADRFDRLGLAVKSWRSGGQIVVAGSTAKAAREHGLTYQEWERQAIRRLHELGLEVIYRPKPNDPCATVLEGLAPDRRPISETLATSGGWVTHHSNSAVDALLAGVPVHCQAGAAAAFSVPLESMVDPPRLDSREQFLADVAWLQWTLDEMRSGECWAHLRTLL